MNRTAAFTEISELLAAFYGALDDGTSEEAAALFLPDGTWMRQGTLLTGPAEIRAALAERPEGRVTLHQFTNLRLTALADGACEFAYALYVNVGQRDDEGRPGLNRVMAMMTCKDRAVATPHGWRFAARTAAPRFHTEL